MSRRSGPATEALEASSCKRCFTKFSDETTCYETKRLRELTLHAPTLSFPAIEWSMDDEELLADLTVEVAAMQPFKVRVAASIEGTDEQKYPDCGSISSIKNPQTPEGGTFRMLRSRSFTSSLSLLDYSEESTKCPRASAA